MGGYHQHEKTPGLWDSTAKHPGSPGAYWKCDYWENPDPKDLALTRLDVSIRTQDLNLKVRKGCLGWIIPGGWMYVVDNHGDRKSP